VQFRYTYQNSRGRNFPLAQIGRILRPALYGVVGPDEMEVKLILEKWRQCVKPTKEEMIVGRDEFYVHSEIVDVHVA